MELRPLKLNGSYEIVSTRSTDGRGHFVRTYDRQLFADHGLITEWEQESRSYNIAADTIRGLHFQLPPMSETKIVRVSSGGIFDVLVDLRKRSETYGEWLGIELSEDNETGVYIPAGFAHGFRTLSPHTIVEYKINVIYDADLAAGLRWNDSDLGINWDCAEPEISERDASLPSFSEFVSPF